MNKKKAKIENPLDVRANGIVDMTTRGIGRLHIGNDKSNERKMILSSSHSIALKRLSYRLVLIIEFNGFT